MTKSIRSQVVLAMVIAVAGSMGFAESGEAVYNSSCKACHGASGIPSPGIAKLYGVKPASEYKSTEAEQIEAVIKGKGKMHPFEGKLSEAQIEAAVKYFRTFK